MTYDGLTVWMNYRVALLLKESSSSKSIKKNSKPKDSKNAIP